MWRAGVLILLPSLTVTHLISSMGQCCWESTRDLMCHTLSRQKVSLKKERLCAFIDGNNSTSVRAIVLEMYFQNSLQCEVNGRKRTKVKEAENIETKTKQKDEKGVYTSLRIRYTQRGEKCKNVTLTTKSETKFVSINVFDGPQKLNWCSSENLPCCINELIFIIITTNSYW